jgi:hypothetical protein
MGKDNSLKEFNPAFSGKCLPMHSLAFGIFPGKAHYRPPRLAKTPAGPMDPLGLMKGPRPCSTIA